MFILQMTIKLSIGASMEFIGDGAVVYKTGSSYQIEAISSKETNWEKLQGKRILGTSLVKDIETISDKYAKLQVIIGEKPSKDNTSKDNKLDLEGEEYNISLRDIKLEYGKINAQKVEFIETQHQKKSEEDSAKFWIIIALLSLVGIYILSLLYKQYKKKKKYKAERKKLFDIITQAQSRADFESILRLSKQIESMFGVQQKNDLYTYIASIQYKEQWSEEEVQKVELLYSKFKGMILL